MKKLIWLMLLLFIVVGCRNPQVYYEPLPLPINVKDGDIIVTDDNQRIHIYEGAKITAIQSTDNGTLITTTEYEFYVYIPKGEIAE